MAWPSFWTGWRRSWSKSAREKKRAPVEREVQPALQQGNTMNGLITGDACMRMTRELSFFRFLSDEELQAMGNYFTCRRVEAGTVLWKEGDPCNFMLFILSGRMLIKKGTEFEGKDVVIGVLSSGSMNGERGLLDGSPHPYTAEALEDLELVMIDHDSFN